MLVKKFKKKKCEYLGWVYFPKLSTRVKAVTFPLFFYLFIYFESYVNKDSEIYFRGQYLATSNLFCGVISNYFILLLKLSIKFHSA